MFKGTEPATAQPAKPQINRPAMSNERVHAEHRVGVWGAKTRRWAASMTRVSRVTVGNSVSRSRARIVASGVGE